jgi:hypothetical protein
MFIRGFLSAQSLALTLDEHREFSSDFIAGYNREFSGRSDDSLFVLIELQHVNTSCSGIDQQEAKYHGSHTNCK